ncbi:MULTISPECIES: hypothetical protein [unclassified Streptomyces]|uniref:hypothetical protein n=1 Tax=unclassified Streptomyces TaxID=2593676 RepID=UPI0036F17D11
MNIAWAVRGNAQDTAAMERISALWDEDAYEAAEAEARALQAKAERLRRRSRGLVLGQFARFMATAAACGHGCGARVLDEMESLAAELHDTAGPYRLLLLGVRRNRMVVLNAERRFGEAEAEGVAVLREAERLKHLTQVWRLEPCWPVSSTRCADRPATRRPRTSPGGICPAPKDARSSPCTAAWSTI